MSATPAAPALQKVPADQAARDRIAHDLDATLVVEAAAGTGKTTALIRRMLSVLTSGRGQLDRMVAVTFTEAAAGELKLRLRTAIEQVRQHPDTAGDVRRRLSESLPQLEAARIGTIHSFCADLLRERPVEAGVDPRFEVATEDLSNLLLAQAFERWFEQRLAAPGEAMRRLLRRRSARGPRDVLLNAARTLIERRDFPTAWQPAPFDREGEIDALLEDMAPLADAVADYDAADYFTRSLRELAIFLTEVRRREDINGGLRDYDGLESELIDMLAPRHRHWTWKGYTRTTRTMSEEQRERVARKQTHIAARDALRERLQRFSERVGAELAPLLQAELNEVVERYEQLKTRAGYLDFLDLLLRARDLVARNDGVRAELQRRFTHLFVDEFQDTDPVQAELLLLLAADDPRQADWERVRPTVGKLFLVGDPKQSIYRFRRADVALYKRIVERLQKEGASLLHLSVSFRGAPAIQQAVNAAFQRCMDGASSSQASYVPLEPYREPCDDRPAVTVLPVPAPYAASGRITGEAVDKSLPDTVAAFIDWLVHESGWKVTERERGPKDIRPQHICLLFKRFRSWGNDVTRPYVRALEARHLPHILVGGSALHSREEIEGIRNALSAIERPDDELSMYATLRGPFFALDDGTLLAWRHRFRSLHPFRQVPDDLPSPLHEVADALQVMRALHLQRNRRPIAATIGHLLAATRAHAGLAIWPGGEQALANVNRLMDLARRAEQNRLISFRSFVDALHEEAENGSDAGEAPIVEEGTEGVRLMTVHRAKGLEFPVVILVDPTAPATPTQADRWVDSRRQLCATRLAGCSPRELLEHGDEEIAAQVEEAVRLVYVAATRARDLLVVTAVADKRLDGWLTPLHPAIYPTPENAQAPLTRQPAGCPELGRDTVRERAEQRTDESVSPGLHRPEVGTHPVVWWDPRPPLLRLDVTESLGLKQNRLLQADDGGAISSAGIEAHEAWQRQRAAVRAAGAVPQMRVLTATEAHAKGLHGAGAVCEIAVERIASAYGRPHGKRFGTLVHAVFAVVDLRADAATVAACAATQGRLLGAPPDEVAAAADVVEKALATPRLRQAAAAAERGSLKRELPIGMTCEDGGTLVEGVLDAAFRADDTAPWTILDFKTDVDASTRLEEYRVQVSLYARALAESTGVAVGEVVLLLV